MARCGQCGTDFEPEVGWNSVLCPNCAAGRSPTRAPDVAPELTAKHARSVLDRELAALTPRVWVTPAIVGANVLVFAAMIALQPAAVWEPTSDILMRLGASFGPSIFGGQWWRVLTAMFLHGGILHLALNMWVLWDLGRMSERLFGNGRYLALYVVCGLAGGVSSLWWHPLTVAVGASGAIFGVAGALLSALYIQKLPLSREVVSKQVRNLTIFVFYNVVWGFGHANIDNAAHAGGLVGGLILGALLPIRFSNPDAPQGAIPDEPPLRRYAALLLVFAMVVGMGWLARSKGGYITDTMAAADLVDHGKVDEGVRRLEKIAAKHDDPMIHAVLGNGYLRQQQAAKAAVELEKLVRAVPDSAAGHSELGLAYYALERNDDALRELELARKLDANDPDTHYRLGLAYTTKERYQDAARSLQRAIELQPDARSYIALGKAELFQDLYDEAKLSFTKAKELAKQEDEKTEAEVMLQNAANMQKAWGKTPKDAAKN